MTVYAEILFVENLISGAVILVLTGKLREIRAGKWRFAAGAVMCGIYAFILFVPLHWAAALPTKILFSSAVVLVVFGADTWRGFIKTTGIFYLVSFLMGGVTIALMYLIGIPGMTANGSSYMQGISYLQAAIGVVATWYLGSWLTRLLKEKRTCKTVIHDVDIHIGDRIWSLKALIDTGNSLREPVTGEPVAVLSRRMGKQIITDMTNYRSKTDLQKTMIENGIMNDIGFCVIPYNTVRQKGIMYGFRPDRVVIDERTVTKIVLGFGERDFSPWRGTEKYDLLLHQQLLEGEDSNGQVHDSAEKRIRKGNGKFAADKKRGIM